jgi:Tfp pilus assembly protein PilF
MNVRVGFFRWAVMNLLAAAAASKESNSSLFSIYSDQGMLWRKKGDLDKAIADCTQAIQLDLKSQDARETRAKAWRAKVDNDKADADFKELQRLKAK